MSDIINEVFRKKYLTTTQPLALLNSGKRCGLNYRKSSLIHFSKTFGINEAT